MKNNFLISFILILNSWSMWSQTEPVVTLELKQTPVTEVLQQIEDQTDVKFYFLEDWIQDLKATGTYQKARLQVVLEEIFANTLINYYIMDRQRVVLTENVRIHSKLPPGFFGNEEKKEDQNAQAVPSLINPGRVADNGAMETVRIGRANGDAQSSFTLSGRITSKESGEPLPGIAVVVRGRNDLGAVSDINGLYELKLPPGENILETKSITTATFQKRVLIFNNGRLDIGLGENLEMLQEVTLDAQRKENIREANTGVNQINVQEIKTVPLVLGERDILKVATTLPGITTAGEGAAGYNVRGGKADQNLILLDDAVIYNPSHFFGIFSALNPFTSGEVKIYKGNMPAEYGGRLSSVFDISTRDATTQKFSGEASIGPVTGNLALEFPVIKDKAGLLVGGRSTYSDWILRSLDEESLKNSTAMFYDVVAKYNHILDEKSEIEATGYFSRDEFSITSDSIYSYSNRLGSLRYNRTLNDRHDASLIVSNSDYEFQIDYEGFSGFDNFSSAYNINETEVKIHLNYRHNETHQFEYGISGKLYNIQPGEVRPLGADSAVDLFRIPKERGLETALFATDNFTVNEKLLINIGARYSQFAALGAGTENVYATGFPKSEATVIERKTYGKNEVMETYGGLEGRISARYFLWPSFSVKGSFNNSLQYIHTLSNNTTISPTDTYKLSNGNIEPQKGSQYSLGLYKNFDNDLYEMSIETYFKKVRNMLDFKVGAQLFLNEAVETEVLQGEGKAYGVEILLKKSRGALNGWVGYSYNRSLIRLDGEYSEERVNNGEYFPSNFDKPHDFSFVGNYKLTKRFSFSTNFVYQTGRPVTFPVGQYTFNGRDYVYYSERNAYRIPDYYRLDLSLNIEGNHKIKKLAHSFWNISVYNVLGRNNPYSVFFVTEGGEVRALQSSIFSIPVPTITYNIKF
ncbi:TonB-dependent receptor [Salinimicrobium oceani]|uniref:TonB-dependent receptor plug domain-containing protein n=1 Tax=Salinimicrobium oceani TaxID=2722702 RepID=A0ABX1CWQ5_9FLAO|nr:carboxypeptidase-like regulatory domain-containing protein [Salinimicrobium oceani]NJW51587.1 TonB-dependent receptor plug domain-containing protein [Salinimicrobium oceani]